MRFYLIPSSYPFLSPFRAVITRTSFGGAAAHHTHALPCVAGLLLCANYTVAAVSDAGLLFSFLPIPGSRPVFAFFGFHGCLHGNLNKIGTSGRVFLPALITSSGA